MWIIPSPISPFVQDTEALISDLNEFSQMCEQSLMWRSKPSQSSTWLRRLKRGGLILRLFGRTLKPSHGNSFVEKWTSSVEASLVNHLAPQEDEEEPTTQGTSSPTSQRALELWGDLPLFSSRMLKESSPHTSEIKVFSNMSSSNWKNWVIERRQAYLVRAKLGEAINENECSFLVLIQDSRSTPNSILVEGQSDILQRGEPPNLSGNHQGQWATPTSRDWKGKYPKESQEKNPRHLLPDQAHLETYKGKLNPRWVETLMGIPIGWTSPSCTHLVQIERMSSDCLETESSLPPQKKPSEPCGKNWSTPTTMTTVEGRSIDSMIKNLTGGGRRNRSSPRTLQEQVDPYKVEMARKLKLYFKENPNAEIPNEDILKSWPTPLVSDHKRRGPNSKQQGLPNVVYKTTTHNLIEEQTIDDN